MTSRSNVRGVEAYIAWKRPVSEARYVDAARTDALGKLGIETVGDLVTHYPRRYLDLSDVASLAEAPIGSEATVVGRVHAVKVKKPRPRLTIVEVALVDGSGVLLGVWFNQPYMAQRYAEGERLAFAGKIEFDYGMKQIKNPFVEKLGTTDDPADLGRILPVHPTTEGVTTNWMRRLVQSALEDHGDVPDPMPVDLRVSRALVPLHAALRDIQFPESRENLAAAKYRLKYDEAFITQCALAMRRHEAVLERPGFSHTIDGECMDGVRQAVPFELTDEQHDATSDLLDDMSRPHPMNRLLLGDVGTGKTVVAAHGLAAAADSEGQAAMMAPTEVLATQYALKVGPLLDEAGISWSLLTGSTPAAERTAQLEELETGETKVVFGTHALLQEDVAFRRLTLAIVDEQHRFGVDQRLALRAKGATPDLLVMTATPIPRSLALTLYGDLATSTLREKPNAESIPPVETRLVARAAQGSAYDVVRSEVAAGHQAYIVCALVEESTETEAKAAVDEAERLASEVFSDLEVGLLTGRMRPAEKADVMDRFRSGDLDVLVSTTVIEVGVDVPNATVMIVEDAERFGLAQLHQLRGRVGRGDHPGHFLLFADPRTDEGRSRMQAVVRTSDGFELAEEDLRLRGEGDVLGSRQSGLPALRLLSLVEDLELIGQARDDALALVENDPHLESPENQPLALAIAQRMAGRTDKVASG
jgi:ATP-dependent DNA helicase RecG